MHPNLLRSAMDPLYLCKLKYLFLPFCTLFYHFDRSFDPEFYITKNSTNCYSIVGWTLNNAVTTRLSLLSNVVHRTILFTIVSAMLFIEQYCSLLFQQCCSALMKQQRLFTVVETGENNIDRTSLFVIVIIVAQPC